MDDNIKYKIIYEKDFKQDIELLNKVCDYMIKNAEYIIENKGDGNKIHDNVYLNKVALESILKWSNGVLDKSESKKESGRKSLEHVIRVINHNGKHNKLE